MSARANQKLYFSKLLLDRAQARTGQPQLADLEGAALHLAVAYRSHIAAVAKHYGETLKSGEHAAELARRLAEHDLHIAELEQLANLEQGDGWVRQLLCLTETITSPYAEEPASAALAPSVDEGQGIPLVQFGSQPLFDPQRTIRRLAEWQTAFDELVSAQHQQSQEW